jgi:hypothetical protein
VEREEERRREERRGKTIHFEEKQVVYFSLYYPVG